MRMRLLLWAVSVLVAAGAAAGAEERILDFHSDITVHKDGSLVVCETIKVHAEGDQIKRGIYRDFPTMYKGKYFTRRWVPFDVVSVLRDGKVDAYHTQGLDNGVRVYIGQENVFIPAGDYTYAITYKTSRQIGFFEDHDELYWNVTGNGWSFAIEKASAVVHLPQPVPKEKLKLAAYTGRQGAKGKDFTSQVNPQGEPSFGATRRLASEEGLTIVVGWPKGHVVALTSSEEMKYFFYDNAGLVVGVFGLVLVFIYLFGAWEKVGKDPAKGTIIPLFDPPEGLSPAAMRYLMHMGYDNKCLTATIINMGVKGLLKVEEKDKKYTLVRQKTDTSQLAPEEKEVWTPLLKRRASVELEQSNHASIGSAIDRLKKSLASEFEKRYFLTNRKYIIPGAVLSLVALLCAGLLFATGLGEKVGFVFMCVWLSGWSVGVIMLWWVAFSAWRAVLTGRDLVSNLVGALFISLFAVPFSIGEGFGLWMLVTCSSVWMPVLLVAAVVMNFAFYHLMKAPTLGGRRLMDKVEGFRMYLRTAERRQLNLLHGPERTPELFEKYLPFALALDVENEWAEGFADVLQQASQAGQAEGGYSPAWYHGTSWSTLGASGFASSVGSSLSHTIASASTAPGSSSGFSGGGGGSSGGGGGGSSGGGGGGGGGGGW